MFQNLKEILLNEIKEDVLEAKKMIDEIKELTKEEKSLKEPEKDISLFKPSDPKDDYNLIGRIFFYKDYKEKKSEYPGKLRDYNTRKEAERIALEEYNTRKNYIDERLKELRSKRDPKQLEEIIERYETIKNAKNIPELGLSFKEVEEIFKEKGLPIVLDDTDQIVRNESKFDKLDDLVLIHKTRYMPNDNEIKTVTNANVHANEQINLGSNTIDVDFQVIRDTVHFAVNGEVGEHFYGNNWNSMKYSIVIPVKDVPNIEVFTTGDTFTRGNVDITKGYLLCPEEEMKEAKEKNSNVTIIGYKGENSHDYANKFISLLGYRFMIVKTHGWETGEELQAENTVKNNTRITYFNEHVDTIDSQTERIRDGSNQFHAIIEKLFESNIDFDPKEATIKLIGDGNEPIQIRMNDYMFITERGKYFYDFVDSLKQYGINTPAYIHQLFNYTYPQDNKRIIKFENIEFPEDVKQSLNEYRELYTKNTRNNLGSNDSLKFAFVYEILKQVKELNKVNIESMEDEKIL